MRLRMYATLGFGIFSILMVALALWLAKSRPWWLVLGGFGSALLITGVVYARLTSYTR